MESQSFSIRSGKIRRRSFLLGGAGVAGAWALGACTSEQAAGPAAGGNTGGGAASQVDVLRLPGGDFGFPSPFTYSRGPGYVQTTKIYDTLVWKDSTGELLPWLAEGWQESEDGLTYTFTLRPNIRWQDGKPLTARDVAFTFDYFRNQTISPQVIIQPLPPIEEVVAIDERTVEFRLASRLATFFEYGGVGSVPIVPEHVWSSVPDAGKASDPALLVGSGPYRLVSYSAGEGIYVYTANDDFFLGAPVVKRLEYRPVNDELQALAAGELDVASAGGVVPAVLEPFRSNPEMTLLDAPNGNSGDGLWWNLERGGAMADPVFRKACARAIDRNDLVQRLYGGNADPGNPGWIPRDNPFHVDVEQYPFDPAAANRMLDQAGYRRGPDGIRQAPDGTPLRFSLLVTEQSQLVDLVVASLRTIGVELTPQAVDRSTFNERVINRESEMSVIGFGGMNTDHAAGYLYQVYSSKTQTTQHAQGYVNPEVDRLVELQFTQLDREQRMQTVAQAQRLIAEDLPILPLVYPRSYGVYRTAAFDQWYYTEGGVGSTVPAIDNKHVFVTGKQTGI
jgi:peptide/nickel transport system substrate-binding protein